MGTEEKLTRATLLLQTGRYDEAAALLADLLRLEPTHIQAHYVLASIRIQQGHKEWANSLLRRAHWLEAPNSGNSHGYVEVSQQDDTDLVYAEDVESRILQSADEFNEWEHDPVAPQNDHINIATIHEVNDTPLETDSRSELNLDSRPLLTLGVTKNTVSADSHTQSKEHAGPAIVWKGRRNLEREERRTTVQGQVNPVEEEPIEKSVIPDIYPNKELSASSEFNIFEDKDKDKDKDEDEEEDEEEDEDDSDIDLYGSPVEHSVSKDEFSHVDEDNGWTDNDVDFEVIDELLRDESDACKSEAKQQLEEYSWSDIDVDFSDLDEDDAEDVAGDNGEVDEQELLDVQERIELWRRTEQIVLELLREAGRLDNPSCARDDLYTLTRVLLEGAAGANRPDISVNVRSKQIGRLLSRNVSVDDIAAAHACRQSWAQNYEFHIDLGGFLRGDGWTRKENVRHLFSWNLALRMVEIFRATEIEEYTYIFFSMFERWNEKRSIQRQFPIFRRYVYFRLLPSGRELDLFPLGVFDDPEGEEYVERWEDDPVSRVTLHAALDAYGLMPNLYRSMLDLPVINNREDGESSDD